MSAPKPFDVKWWPIADVIPYELNSKKHPKEQVAKIAKSIELGGWDQPIVVDREGVIIKGHGRRLAAILRDDKHVPVLQRKDLTPDQVKAARLADNRSALSDIDPELLRQEMLALPDADTLLDGIFDKKELDFLDADLGTMDTSAFETDMGSVIDEQKKEVAEKIAKVEASRISLIKAFGFKDLPAAGQIAITALMARAEAATGLKNDEALIGWANSL